jgi:glycosyltransferase involved in cell wall biosynthesis
VGRHYGFQVNWIIPKENTIISVGEIGTNPKNNMELIVAFAKASDVLKNWKLKLIGNIEPEFQVIINNFIAIFPDLKERIIFTGAITDKIELYNEYAKAKIFALTSLSEGLPNVYSEALFHGCMFITSDVDAADDITNCGELGMKYKRGDIEELTRMLIKLCSDADTSAFSRHIPKSLNYAAKYYDWNRNAKKLAYALLKPKLTTT